MENYIKINTDEHTLEEALQAVEKYYEFRSMPATLDELARRVNRKYSGKVVIVYEPAESDTFMREIQRASYVVSKVAHHPDWCFVKKSRYFDSGVMMPTKSFIHQVWNNIVYGGHFEI
jgi:hypothetical protein